MGFADTPTDTLQVIRRNLLRGLDLVAQHADAGTLHTIPPGKSSPPIEAGQLTRILLAGVDAELARRTETPLDHRTDHPDAA